MSEKENRVLAKADRIEAWKRDYRMPYPEGYFDTGISMRSPLHDLAVDEPLEDRDPARLRVYPKR